MLIPKTNNDSIEEVDYVDAREGSLQKGIKSLVGTLYTYLVLIGRHWVGMHWTHLANLKSVIDLVLKRTHLNLTHKLWSN